MFSSAFLSVLFLTLLSPLILAAPAPGSKVSPSLGVSCKTTADCKDGLICSTDSSTCSYSATVRQPSGNVPNGWTCNSGWYNTDDGCDCGCGVIDPDCHKENQSLFCPNSDHDTENSRCDLNQNVCVAKPPEEWICTENWYDTNDGCDCGCGATDPDCDKEDQTLYCMNSPLSASESSCDFTTNKCVPNDWTCNTSWYDEGLGCDCGCGATDPDCEKDNLILFCHNSPLNRLLSRCNLGTNECELNPNGRPNVETPPRPRRARAPRATPDAK